MSELRQLVEAVAPVAPCRMYVHHAEHVVDRDQLRKRAGGGALDFVIAFTQLRRYENKARMLEDLLLSPEFDRFPFPHQPIALESISFLCKPLAHPVQIGLRGAGAV